MRAWIVAATVSKCSRWREQLVVDFSNIGRAMRARPHGADPLDTGRSLTGVHKSSRGRDFTLMQINAPNRIRDYVPLGYVI